MGANNLLVELLVEELPPKALKKLGEAFAVGIAAGLAEAELIDSSQPMPPASFATPRRLAVWLPNVRAKAQDRSETKKLVPVSVGLAGDDKPPQALVKKLASLGLGPDASYYPRPDGKAPSLFVDRHVRGSTLAEGLQKALDDTLAKLPIPKVMSYQLADGWSSVNFVRPAHGLVALYGDEVVEVQALGLRATRVTQGHRFEAEVATVELRSADSYEPQLQAEGAVIASFAQRREAIAQQIQTAAAALGLRASDDDARLGTGTRTPRTRASKSTASNFDAIEAVK